MQFSQIIVAIAMAASASAMALEKKNSSPSCNSIAICKTGSKSSCEKPEPCQASGGDPYCCTTIGLVNVLNCVNLLNGNTVNISLLDGSSLPITLPL